MTSSESEETSRIVQLTDAFFSDDTPLRQAPEYGGRPYEPRPQQHQMALAIAEHLDQGCHLCVEAPTGVGKTFAYLVPAMYYAQQYGLPVVVTTHTISLQEQILEKDLPVLRGLTGIELEAAVAKGRSNYLCLRRLHGLVEGDQDMLPGAEMLSELDAIYHWSERTEDGSRSELAFEPAPALWEAVCCEVGNCMNARCPFFKRCFLIAARRRLSQVHIIVANHALFFTDLAMKRDSAEDSAGMLPSYGAVVFDEGQTMEDEAAGRMGLRITGFDVTRLLRKLYYPERHRGILLDSLRSEAKTAVQEALQDSEAFFTRLRLWLEKHDKNPLRHTRPGQIPNLLSESLERVEREIGRTCSEEDDAERLVELTAAAEQVRQLRFGLHTFLEMTADGHVYWFERYGRGLQNVSLNAVPIEVAPMLREHLFDGDATVIVTSATLAVRGRMDYFQKRIGAEDTEALVLDSPFDFERQVDLYMPFDMPNPNNTSQFVPAACEHIRQFLLRTQGKAFVLFTSYHMMHHVASELAEFFETSGIQLFMQGEGMPRSRMLQAFRDDVDSVIFGTASFWTGVDVPGEALSNVIIVRLPFAVPDHPLIAARQEAIELNGGKAFFDYALPEAILKFRQGFGRLIRSREDKGIVVVLDNRIIRTGYGKAFLASIPACNRQVF